MTDALDGLREIMLAVEQSRHTIAARLELNISDMSALSYIRSRGALGQKDLADYLGFSTSSITTLIDRLEAKNLLRRTAHPNDRRRTIVTITDHGLDIASQIRDWYTTALDTVPAADIAAAAAALTAVAHKLTNQTSGLAPGRGQGLSLAPLSSSERLITDGEVCS
jgi:DNA-binding MarR family transcriptional regulator